MAEPDNTTIAPKAPLACEVFAPVCAIAAMDAEAEAAMADFKWAAALQRDETLPAKRRRALQKLCEDASFRMDALCYAMGAYPA